MSRLEAACSLSYAGGFELEAVFEAGDGVTALFGPSGSGKSTTLALLAGLLRPTRGHIRLGGRPLVDTAAGVWVPPEKRRIGMVFQDHLLFPHLTVRQNLLFGRGRHSRRDISLTRVVEVLEIGGLLDRRPDAVSGGQRQRVALGRALLTGPELLLMDEPLAALDEPLRDRILTYLERALAEWRVPTLFVSHDQTAVHRLAGQVIVLDAGRVVAAGPTAQTLDHAGLTRMKHRLGPVALLRVEDARPVGAHWEGRLGIHRLFLPAGPFSPGDTLLVQLFPRDVILAREPNPGLSVRNQIPGTVTEVLPLEDLAFVAVDVGQLLWAQVTPEAIRDLALAPGQPVTCLIKAVSLTVLR